MFANKITFSNYITSLYYLDYIILYLLGSIIYSTVYLCEDRTIATSWHFSLPPPPPDLVGGASNLAYLLVLNTYGLYYIDVLAVDHYKYRRSFRECLCTGWLWHHSSDIH